MFIVNMLPLAALMLQWQSWIVPTETICLIKAPLGPLQKKFSNPWARRWVLNRGMKRKGT